MRAERRSIEVSADADALRRKLGPTAWFVFEAMLFDAHGSGHALTAVASARSLAVELGLAKNTVARAIAQLRAAGLIARCQSRSTAGTFIAGSYAITLPSSITVRVARRPRELSLRSPASGQLALAIGS